MLHLMPTNAYAFFFKCTNTYLDNILEVELLSQRICVLTHVNSQGQIFLLKKISIYTPIIGVPYGIPAVSRHSWLMCRTAPAADNVYGINQQMKDTFFSLPDKFKKQKEPFSPL